MLMAGKSMLKKAFKKALATGLGACILVFGGAATTPAQQPERPRYEGRKAVLYLLEENCFFADQRAHAKKRLNPAPGRLSRLFREMEKNSRTGRALAEGARSRDLAYCQATGFERDTGAAYHTSIGMIELNWKAAHAYNHRVLAHETMHGIQGAQTLLKPENNWSLETRLRVALYEEAAGKAAEVAVGFEQKQAGDAKVWDELAHHYKDKIFSGPKPPAAFRQAHKRARKNGLSEPQAVGHGTSAAWGSIFNRRGWREYYITSEMSDFIEHMNKNAFDGSAYSLQDANDPDRARASGKIAQGISLSEYVLPPSRAVIFKGLPRLEEAFEALELAHAERAFGQSDQRATALRAQLTGKSNRYLDIDWKKVEDIYDKTRDFQSMDALMDRVLAMQKPLAPAQNKGSRP